MKLAKLLRESPSLKPALAADLEDTYRYGRKTAVGETGFLESSFPDACPFTLAQILEPEFFPE